MLTPEEAASNNHKMKLQYLNSVGDTITPDFQSESPATNQFHYTPMPSSITGFTEYKLSQNYSSSPGQNEAGVTQRDQISMQNQSQLTVPPSAADNNKINIDYTQKSKSSATPQVKESLNKDWKKTRFNVPKIQMPPIIANHNKPLSLNDKHMFGCYIQQVQEISVPRTRVHEPNGVSSDRKGGKLSKSKHKVTKGPSIENLVFTPCRAEYTNHLPAQPPLSVKGCDSNWQENYLKQSKSTNTRKIQPIQRLTEEVLDLDTELWVEQNRYQQRAEQYVQQKSILQKLYVKKEMKKAPSIKQSPQRDPNTKKSKSPGARRKHTHDQCESSQNPQESLKNQSSNLLLSDSFSNMGFDDQIMNTYYKLQNHCSNLNEFISKTGTMGKQVNKPDLADPKTAAQQILQMNKTFKTGQKLKKIKQEVQLNQGYLTQENEFYSQNDPKKKLQPLSPQDFLQKLTDNYHLNPTEANSMRASYDKELAAHQLRQTQFVNKRRSSNKLDPMDTMTRNNLNRTQEVCIGNQHHLNTTTGVTTPVQNEKTRMRLSIPELNEKDNQVKAMSGSGIRSASHSLHDEVTDKSSQLYNVSILQLKNAMRIMPEVRPIVINNRHNCSSRNGVAESMEKKGQKENMQSLFIRSPVASPSFPQNARSKKINSRKQTPQNTSQCEKPLTNDSDFQQNHDISHIGINFTQIDEGNSTEQEIKSDQNTTLNDIEKNIKNKKKSEEPISRNSIKFKVESKALNINKEKDALKSPSKLSSTLASPRTEKREKQTINSGEHSLKSSSRKNSNVQINKQHRNSLKTQTAYHKHKQQKKQKEYKIDSPRLDKLSLSQKVKTARILPNTTNDSFIENQNSKAKLLGGSMSSCTSPTGVPDRRYQQLMAQSFIPELNVLEKRISRLNKMPDQFNQMMLKRSKGSSDTGVMSILKVSDEKFHMKQAGGYLIPNPIGVDTTQGQSTKGNSLYKIQPNQIIKNRTAFTDMAVSPFAKGSKKRVNFDLPMIQKPEISKTDSEHYIVNSQQEQQVHNQQSNEDLSQANFGGIHQRSRSLVEPIRD